MRWLPMLLVTALMIGLLVASDPDAFAFTCGRVPAAAATGVAADERIGPCHVERVVDGDSLELRCPEGPERVRLLRIDTPERDEPGWAEARTALRALTRGASLDLVLERREDPVRDRYARLLVYLYAGERNLNVEMVGRGWSEFDRRFGAGRFAGAFVEAERSAREARRGLWATPSDAGSD